MISDEDDEPDGPRETPQPEDNLDLDASPFDAPATERVIESDSGGD